LGREEGEVGKRDETETQKMEEKKRRQFNAMYSVI